MATKKTKDEVIAGLQEHVLSLERRLMSNRDGEDDDDDVDPIFSNTSQTQLAFRIEDVARQRDQYKGAIEVGLIENNKLREERDHYRNLYMGLASSSSTNNTNNAGIT